MKIGKALSEKKAAQNALARLMSVRGRTFFTDKGKKPDITIGELEKQIETKKKRILDLKLRIMYTNTHTRLPNGMSLQEAIVRLGDLRSELQAYNELLALEPGGHIVYVEGRPQMREQVAQLDRKVLLKRIEDLEAEKYEIDSLIAHANNQDDLVERIPPG